MSAYDLAEADYLTRLTVRRLAELNATRARVRPGAGGPTVRSLPRVGGIAVSQRVSHLLVPLGLPRCDVLFRWRRLRRVRAWQRSMRMSGAR